MGFLGFVAIIVAVAAAGAMAVLRWNRPGWPPKRIGLVALRIVAPVVGIVVLIGAWQQHPQREPERSAEPTPTFQYEEPEAPQPPTTEEISRGVIQLCQKAVLQRLRDPESARFQNWSAQPLPEAGPGFHAEYHPENGDRPWFARGLVNAKNGFGGYVGDEEYDCDASVSTDYSVRAAAWPSADAQTAG